MLLAAARDGDAGLRELALPVLAARKDSALPALIAFQLRDADPDLRLLGLNQLGGVSSNAALPLIAAALDDTNVIVAASAIAALQKISGKDFGVHVAKVLGEKAPPEAIREFEAQRKEARDWISQHQTVAAARTNSIELPPFPEAAVVAGFKLRDINGNAVRLSDFRGKIVLLNFWTTWCTACQGEFAALNELQKKHPNDLVVVGISLDSNSDAGAEDGAGAKGTTVEQRVARTIKARGIQYRILLDPESSVGARFNGGELPTNVLIDKQGRFARRFIGPRSAEVFEGMLAPLE
jgi:thiol-disulfide isomerase/thioredoxin